MIERQRGNVSDNVANTRAQASRRAQGGRPHEGDGSTRGGGREPDDAAEIPPEGRPDEHGNRGSGAVAITGVGLICPAGIGLDVAVARLAAGPLKAELPDNDEALGLPDSPRLLVPRSFKPRSYLPKRRRKDLKLMARANRLAVAAACLAMDDAGLDLDADWSDCGLMLGVGIEPGNLKDGIPPLVHSLGPDGTIQLDRLIDEGLSWMNPLSSLKTLPNMSLAHVAIRLGAMGPSQTRCTGPTAGLDALAEAVRTLHEGRAPMMVAGASDTWVSFTDRLRALRLGVPLPPSEAAALFVLEPLPSARARGARIRAVLRLTSDRGSPPRLDLASPALAELGECGAATGAAALALAVGRGERAALGAVAVDPPGPDRAPAIRVASADDPVAITGVGLASPLGHDFETFSAALLRGDCGTGPIRAFDARRFPVRNACEVPDFDPDARLPATLLAATRGLDDRKTELALAAALDAVHDHGDLDPSAGVAYATGLSSVSFREFEEDYAPFLDAEANVDWTRFAREQARARDTQSPRRHIVDRPLTLLRTYLGLAGPTTCHFSACAAAAEAIGHAVDRIRRGEVPMMLAGGADSMVHPLGMAPFILLGATSPEVDPQKAGRPFDQARDGFVMGEGGAFFVLEPLSRARAAGRRIYGLVRGWGSSCDAHNVTAPHPEGLGAERAMRAALDDAGLPLSAVDYINAHGTGTALNDVTEAGAIRRLFGEKAPPVSSSKAQIGHTIAAAGAMELLACLAAFHGGRLPPNPHLETPDRAVDLDLVEPAGRAGTPRIILSNSFGFGGQNACLALGHPESRS